jgi:hypothetical protein
MTAGEVKAGDGVADMGAASKGGESARAPETRINGVAASATRKAALAQAVARLDKDHLFAILIDYPLDRPRSGDSGSRVGHTVNHDSRQITDQFR